MASSTAMNSFDTILYVSPFTTADPSAVADLESAPWEELEEVISVNGIPLEPSVTNITHLRSPGKAKEKVPGFLDAGQCTFKMNYNKTLVTAILLWLPGGANAGDVSPAWGRCKFS